MQAGKHVAILGFRLESNANAPVCQGAEFIALKGPALIADLGRSAPRAPQEVSSFLEAMSQRPGTRTTPVSLAAGGAGGPVDHTFLEDWIDDALARLRAIGPVDGLYLAQHGAMISTRSHDPDGELFARLRAALGSDIPIVVSLDPHANVSRKMVENCDAMIAYRTNPHVDQREVGREAAGLMSRLLAGERTRLSLCKLPLIPPSTAQNTKNGPLGEHIAFGDAFVGDDILAVCVCSGFSVGDSAKAGMSVIVTERASGTAGPEAARTVASRIWEERERYLITLTPLDTAIARMVALSSHPSAPSLCFADVADNPGGGGRGNTTYILRAMLDAGVHDAVLAPFFDPALAAEARDRGPGASFEAHFNRDERSPYSEPLTARATVLRLDDAEIVCRRGILAGRRASMGLSALLDLGGVRVVATSRRVQFCDPAMLECFGIGLSEPRALVVKSRGHFRAAIDEVFSDDRIVEIDAPGLTTPVLSRVPWRNIPRPIYPLDRDMAWSPG